MGEEVGGGEKGGGWGEAEGKVLEDTESLCTSRHKTLPSFFFLFSVDFHI